MRDKDKSSHILLDEIRKLRRQVRKLKKKMADLSAQSNQTSIHNHEPTTTHDKFLLWMTEHTLDVIAEFDLEHYIRYISPSLKLTIGVEPEDLIGLHASEFIHPDDLENVLLWSRSAVLTGSPQSFEYRVKKDVEGKDWIWLEAVGIKAIYDNEDNITSVVFGSRDITQRKLAEQALKESEDRYRAVVEDQTEYICRFLADGTITFVNNAWLKYFCKQQPLPSWMKITDFVYEEDLKAIRRLILGLNPANPATIIDIRVILLGGTLRWVQTTVRAFFEQDGSLKEFQTVGRDITEQKAAEEQLRYLSFHDALTGLYNRMYFEEEIRRLNDGRIGPVGVIVCDLDGLKLINDIMGHDAGDILLVTAATLIKKCFRHNDVVARIGGDEFAILMPGATMAAVQSAYDRIIDAVSHHNESFKILPISVSVGYAVREDKTVSIKELLNQADSNMYHEKIRHRLQSKSAFMNTVLHALATKDFHAQGHAERLQARATRLAAKVGFTEDLMNDLNMLVQFHDVGNIMIPDSIILKPGPLTSEERKIIKTHSEKGYRAALSFSHLTPIAVWILNHHEWWNGEGYPLGLKGNEIPIASRILAIIDAYDAITNDRPYRTALRHEDAVKELIAGMGTQFDPHLTPIFIKMMDEEINGASL